MSEELQLDFDSKIDLCESQADVLKICLEYIERATKAVTSDNIGMIEHQLDEHYEAPDLINLEKSVKKLLEMGVNKMEIQSYVSKFLDNIQCGKIYCIFFLVAVYIYYFILTFFYLQNCRKINGV